MDLSLFFILYFAILAFLGFYMRKIRDSVGFILADRKIGFSFLVATLVATFYGASAVIGTAGIANSLGLAVLWFIIPFYLGNLFVIKALPKIRDEGAYTLPDYLGKRFGSKTAVSAAVILAVLCLVPESIIAAGKILALTTPLTLDEGMVLVFLVVVVYTLLGGMKSVIASDLLQLSLMLAAMLLFLPFLLSAFFSGEIQAGIGFLEGTAYLGWQEALSWSILLFFLPVTSAPLYQRIFASAPEVDVKKAIGYALILWVFIDFIVVSAGLYSVKYALEDPDQALLAAAADILPGFLQPIFFLGLLSAMLSTADSYLHSGASSFSYDIYRRFFGEKRIVLYGRVMIVLLGAASLAIAFYFREIIPAMIFLLTLWTSGILVPTLAALYGLRLGDRGALCSIVAGSLSSLIWYFYPPMEINPLFIGLLLSFIAAAAFKDAN